mgnify:FL=1
MTEQNTKQGGIAGMEAGRCKHARTGSRYQSRDYNYVLRLSEEELAVLKKYRNELVAGTSRFA